MKDAAQHCKDWIGKTETIEDDLSSFQARAAAAMLDIADVPIDAGAPLPPLWQWFYFLATVPQARLGGDGHPERGGFMPPVPLPRRMFAGSRMRFHRPLVIGRPATREGLIRDVVIKHGQSGELVFVTVGYVYRQAGEVCIEEEQDIVYREPGAAVAAPEPVALAPPAPQTWCRDMQADSRLLFRFSALTFNAHRIHYDRAYATQEEGYPGLIVHGPLTAVLLADLVRSNDARPILSFRFRGQAPLFDLSPFRLTGKPDGPRVELQACGPDGRTTLVATAELG